MIKTISALSKYKNEAARTEATDKLTIKSIVIPDVYESDDSTINFVKRVGGEIFQCYSLSEVKQRIPEICVPSFKEMLYSPCRATSAWVEVPCLTSDIVFEESVILDYDFKFISRNNMMVPDYNYETGSYGPEIPDTTPLPLRLTLDNVIGFWTLKINNELIYSSENIGDFTRQQGVSYGEGGEIFIVLPITGDTPVNSYEFRGELDSIRIENWYSDGETVAKGSVSVLYYDSPNIKRFMFNLREIDLALPSLPSHVTSTRDMFYSCFSITSDITSWNTSNVTDMMYMFFDASNFNQNIRTWNLSNVVTTEAMFGSAHSFNQDISRWDVSSVTNMSAMFVDTNFNQDISSWDVSNVVYMGSMFHGNSEFNQDLSSWCVENILEKPDWFDESTPSWVASKPIWGTCPVREVEEEPGINTNLIFSVESYENPTNNYPLYVYLDNPVGDWFVKESGVVVADSTGFSVDWIQVEFDMSGGADIYFEIVTPEIKYFESNVTADYVGIYYNGISTEERSEPLGEVIIEQFSPNISEMSTGLFSTKLQVPQVIPAELTDVNRLFINAHLFDQDISMWDVSNITNMDRMFENAKTFNQDLSGWCVPDLLEEPNNFSLNADSWTLPKPIWGTCPDRTEPPPVIDTNFVFSVQDIASEGVDFEVWMNKGGRGPGEVVSTEPWELVNLDTGQAVANSEGYADPTYVVRNETYFVSVTIPMTTSPVRYEFIGTGTYAGFGYYSDNHPDADYPPAIDDFDIDPEIKVVVESFSATIESYEFYVDYADLTVPDRLPAHITDCSYMFEECFLFNQDLSTWNTVNVTNMDNMFAESRFNQDISMWNVSNVVDMESMFWMNHLFNQDLSQWCVSNIASEPSDFSSESMSWTLPKPVWGTCPRGELEAPIVIEPEEPPVIIEGEGLIDPNTQQLMAYTPEFRCNGGYGSASAAYQSWATDLGVSTLQSLPGLTNVDDGAATVDVGFIPLVGGVSTKVTLSSEGGFGLYRTNPLLQSDTFYLQLTAPEGAGSLSPVSRFYLNATTPPALMIMTKSLDLDGQNLNSKWQKAGSTAIFYTEYSHYSNGTGAVRVALKLKAGGHIEIVVSEANSSASKLQFLPFKENINFSESSTAPIQLGYGGFGVNIPQNTCMIYSTQPVAACSI